MQFCICVLAEESETLNSLLQGTFKIFDQAWLTEQVEPKDTRGPTI